MSEHVVAERYEAAIRQVEGVVSCKVVLSDEGQIEEIHIMASTKRNPKQIVRDVETACMIHFGKAIDHRKISIMQTQQELPPSVRRLLLQSVSYVIGGEQLEVIVALSLGDAVERGRAQGLRTKGGQNKLVAEATLAAVSAHVMQKVGFVLEQVTVIPFAQHQVALAAVTMIGRSDEETLIGAAFVRGDEREAVVKATLDAVNRKTMPLLED